ncbi:f-box protein [Fusarium flagelliforme]|uniref:F-box protein n=1 Tax=Fusarium flagelliforme TaxID=2675880 RepID=A0A395MLP2_9HYPO|nr:f-box protein [Fusarium flagelliforme]
MTLLDLPIEVLRLILQLVEPDDFESLMLVCKLVHKAGYIFIAKHNHYKATFRHVQIHAQSTTSDKPVLYSSLAELVGILATKPRAAAYIRTLAIYGPYRQTLHMASMDVISGGERCALELDRTGALVAERISESPWLKAAGCDVTTWLALVDAVRNAGEDGEGERYEDQYNRDGSYQTWREYADFCLFILLLTQLTRLQTLQIKHDFHYASSYEDDQFAAPVLVQAKRVLDLMSLCADKDSRALISQSSVKISSLPASPLESLAELYYCSRVGGSYPLDATALHPFIGLPSLRRLRAHDLKTLSSIDYSYTWPPQKYLTKPIDDDIAVSSDAKDGHGSQLPNYYNNNHYSLLASKEHRTVEYLELLRCDLSPRGIASLIERMPLLDTVRYTYKHKSGLTEYDAVVGWDFDAGTLLQAIADASRVVVEGVNQQQHVISYRLQTDGNSSKESSRRSRNYGQDDSEYSIPTNRITDLAIGIEDCPRHIVTGISGATIQQFRNIRKLALDVRMFLGPTPESGERRDSYSCWDPKTSNWNPETDIPSLIDVLPSSLESLELFVDMQGSEGNSHRQYWDLEFVYWTKLLAGFREGRDERLPNLKDFVVRENPLMFKGHRPSGVYEEVVLSDDSRSVANRRAALEAGADFVSADGIQMSWREGLEE